MTFHEGDRHRIHLLEGVIGVFLTSRQRTRRAAAPAKELLPELSSGTGRITR
jgi:hypothetical protein